MARDILKGPGFVEKDCADTYHERIEAIKTALAGVFRYLFCAAKQ